mmetsp:Transcript_18561/g.42436  ORF Transcript_18561/g.42436 Transcript_18561/m.42436 type:complete len:250 (+) Transcript_18561:501-1250(+)
MRISIVRFFSISSFFVTVPTQQEETAESIVVLQHGLPCREATLKGVLHPRPDGKPIHRHETVRRYLGLAVGLDTTPSLSVGRGRPRHHFRQQTAPERRLRLSLGVPQGRRQHRRDAPHRPAAVRLLERVARPPRLEVLVILPDGAAHVVGIRIVAAAHLPQHAEETKSVEGSQTGLAVRPSLLEGGFSSLADAESVLNDEPRRRYRGGGVGGRRRLRRRRRRQRSKLRRAYSCFWRCRLRRRQHHEGIG